MKLKEYLKLTNIRIEDFAKLAGIKRSSMYRYVTGHKMNIETALKIESATGSKVTIHDLVGEINERAG